MTMSLERRESETAGAENENVQNTEKTVEPGTSSCEHKCLHPGNHICYNDSPDKQIVKKICHEEEISSNTTTTTDLVSQDSTIHSGESIYKTFTFNAPESDRDMKKCMAFWKSILDKNIKPVKCTLLKKAKKEKTKKEEKISKSADPCDNEENQKMWHEIYKDLQKRQLDKIKLGTKKQPCNPCDDYIDEELEKKQDSEDIKNLNNWKPPTAASVSSIVKSNLELQMKRTLEEIHAHKSSKLQTVASKEGSNLQQKTSISTKDNKRKSSLSVKKSKETVSENQMKTTSRQGSLEEITPPSAEASVESVKIVKMPSSLGIGSSRRQSQRSSFKSTELPLNETAESANKPEETTNTQELEAITEEQYCCKHGCLINICKCNTGVPASCIPCDCGDPCICEDGQLICKCGCKLDECICEILETSTEPSKTCKCGCMFDECVCETSTEELDKTCPCGCGLEECICEVLFERACKCGHDDCTCDICEILSDYLESLSIKTEDVTPDADVKTTKEGLRFASQDAQTEIMSDAMNWTIEETKKEGSYCVICGHFNCFCKIKKPEQ